MTDNPAQRIDALLDALRHATLNGDLPALAGIEAALHELEAAPGITAAELRALREKALRNQSLVLSAGRGIRRAQQRLEDMARALSGLAFYDAQGRLQRRDPTGRALTRRI